MAYLVEFHKEVARWGARELARWVARKLACWVARKLARWGARKLARWGARKLARWGARRLAFGGFLVKKQQPTRTPQRGVSRPNEASADQTSELCERPNK